MTAAVHPAARAPSLHVICDRDVGLFNLVLSVVSHIHWAQREGRIPIVYYTDRNCYFVPGGYRGGDTVWEYYFEPVAPGYPAAAVPTHIRALVASKPALLDSWNRQRGHGFFGEDGTFLSNDSGGQVFIEGETVKGYRAPGRALRAETARIIREYIHPRSYITEQVDRFFSEQMAGRYVIGVHIRGTDALADPDRVLKEGRINFPKYFAVIDRLIRRRPDARILVASDAHESVERVRARFPDRVIAYDSVRHESGEAAGRGPEGGLMPAYLAGDRARAARNGEDAVIEYLLLCRCSYLVHNSSGIPRAVLLTVPEMPDTSTVPLSAYWRRMAVERYRRHSSPVRRVVERWSHLVRSAQRVVAGQPLVHWGSLLRAAWRGRAVAGRRGESNIP